MSHELRTPLNSVLILSQQLAENADGNLVPKQVEFARTIHGAGADLLNLITDILDLSKIESGTVTVEAEEIDLPNLIDAVSRQFRHEAERRQLDFDVDVDPNIGRSIVTDSKRLQQVLKNLMSNSLKFTERRQRHPARIGGQHRLESASRGAEPDADGGRLRSDRHRHRHSARKAEDHLRGLPAGRCLAPAANTAAPASASPSAANSPTCSAANSHCAAHRAPAARSSSICRSGMPAPSPPNASPSGGEQQPSTFRQVPRLPERPTEHIPDDRLDIQPGDLTLLIVEDDPHYARILAGLARDQGFKVLIAARGADAIDLAQQYSPSAVSLDVFLPDTLGWNVLEPTQAESGNPAHPGPDRHLGRGSPARPVARRLLIPHQAGERARSRKRSWCASAIMPAASRSGCSWSRTMRPN